MDPLGKQIDGLAEIYDDPDEVQYHLSRLFDLTWDPFLKAIELAWLEWAGRTEYDAPSFPGTLLWGHTVRHERRELFTDFKWPANNTNNFATSISPNGQMAIAVETGNRFTGTKMAGRHPRTNSMKGPRTMQMVLDNNAIIQGNLFTGFAQAGKLGNDAPLLWIHLIRVSRGDVVHELSLPTVADKRNRIVGWRCRMILPRWHGGASDPAKRQLPAPEPAADAELRITRRNA